MALAGFVSPPGLDAPPGLSKPDSAADPDADVRLLEEQRRLQEQALLHQVRLQQHAALMQQHMLLRQMQANLVACQPGFALAQAQLSASMSKLRTGSLVSEAASTCVGSDASSGEASPRQSDSDSEETRTTMMMRNLPNSYTRDMLQELLDFEGFRGSYDLLYVPIDFASEAGFGYSFINFVSAGEALRFRTHFQGFRAWQTASDKVCDVTWGSNQGLRANLQRYRNCPVMHESVPDKFKPATFVNGARAAFPAPTRSIRAPEVSSRR
jgi:hypothetical protein